MNTCIYTINTLMPSVPPKHLPPGIAAQRAQALRDANTHTNRLYDSRWRKFRNRYVRDNPLCALCLAEGLVSEGVELDHIKPISEGGAMYDQRNLQLLCRTHHARKRQLEGQSRRFT